MSTNHYRALIALANVLLVLAISYVGFRTFVGRPTPPDEEPPKNFNPLNYEIQNDVAKRSSISEHRITWAMLDRPLEVREVPRVEQAAPVRPPVQDLTNKVLSYLPQVAGAILVFLIGWFVARVIQRVVTSVLSASGLDRVGEKIGLGTALGNRTLSGVVGAVVYALILIPVLIAALDALALDAVTEPASAMLGRLLDAIPMIFAAAVLLIVSYFIARLVGSLVSNLLVGIGFDTVLSKLGLGTRTHTPGRRTPSEIVGFVVVVAVLLFASAEAAAMLEFDTLSMLISELTMFGGQVVFGIVIFSLGLLLANLVASTVRSSGVRQANLLAILSRVAILAVIGAMAIRHIVPESEIVDLAFSLTLGAFAVAAAIAFGWGGRDVARQLVTEWTAKLREPDVTER